MDELLKLFYSDTLLKLGEDIGQELITKVKDKTIGYYDVLLLEEFEIEPIPDWVSELSNDKYMEGADPSLYDKVWGA